MNSNNLNWLLNWHLKTTHQNENNSNWIQINTLDNPGWYFQASLSGTGLEYSRFDKIKIDRDENDWVYCYVKNGFFESPCGPLNLIEALQIFRDWVETHDPITAVNELTYKDNLEWIMEWRASQCDGYWEHQHGLCFLTTDEPGWSFRCSLGETELEEIPFDPISIQHSKTNWINCYKKNDIFEGRCSVQNLNHILEIFRNWAEAAQESE